MSLWDYNRLFPTILSKNIEGGNKTKYWSIINKEILRITGISQNEFDDFIICANSKIYNCIEANLQLLESKRNELIAGIKIDVSKLDEEILRESLIDFRIKSETKVINQLIGHIQDFRLF